MNKVFANGLGTGVQSKVESHEKLEKMVPDAALLNTQHYKVTIKVEQSRELSSALLYTSVCCILTFDPAQNAIQGDVPEASDTFQWQLGEEIALAEIGWWNGTS